jgi:hypothetical protein
MKARMEHCDAYNDDGSWYVIYYYRTQTTDKVKMGGGWLDHRKQVFTYLQDRGWELAAISEIGSSQVFSFKRPWEEEQP